MSFTKDSHRWTEEDDTIVYYVVKCGINGLGMNEDQLADHIGVSTSTFKMRKGNHRRQLNSTKTIDRVHQLCSGLDCGEFRSRALRLLRK